MTLLQNGQGESLLGPPPPSPGVHYECPLGCSGLTDWSAARLQQLAEAVHAKQAPHEHALAEERKKKNYREFWAVISLKDPFRLVLSEMRDRLFHTREILHHCLVHPKYAPVPCGNLHAKGRGGIGNRDRGADIDS